MKHLEGADMLRWRYIRPVNQNCKPHFLSYTESLVDCFPIDQSPSHLNTCISAQRVDQSRNSRFEGIARVSPRAPKRTIMTNTLANVTLESNMSFPFLGRESFTGVITQGMSQYKPLHWPLKSIRVEIYSCFDRFHVP